MEEELAIKIESDKVGGIFKWLYNDELLLLITLYNVDSSRRSHQSMPNTFQSVKFVRGERNSAPSSRIQMSRLIF